MQALQVTGSIQVLWEWGMPSFIWHSIVLIYSQKWSQGFLTMVSGMGFDTNPFLPHKS